MGTQAHPSTVGASSYKSILSNNTSKRSSVVGLNPNMKPTTQQSYTKIFPMYGLWSEDATFQSTKQAMGVPEQVMKEELAQVNRSHFKVMYKEKEFMEEMLKAKNMMGNKNAGGGGGAHKWGVSPVFIKYFFVITNSFYLKLIYNNWNSLYYNFKNNAENCYYADEKGSERLEPNRADINGT